MLPSIGRITIANQYTNGIFAYRTFYRSITTSTSSFTSKVLSSSSITPSAESSIFTPSIEHRRHVCRLFKRFLLELRNWLHREDLRIYSQAVRAQFDRHKNERDPLRVAELVAATEELLEYWKQPRPIIYPLSPGGVSYGHDSTYTQDQLEYGHRVVRGDNWREEQGRLERMWSHGKEYLYVPGHPDAQRLASSEHHDDHSHSNHHSSHENHSEKHEQAHSASNHKHSKASHH